MESGLSPRLNDRECIRADAATCKQPRSLMYACWCTGAGGDAGNYKAQITS